MVVVRRQIRGRGAPLPAVPPAVPPAAVLGGGPSQRLGVQAGVLGYSGWRRGPVSGVPPSWARLNEILPSAPSPAAGPVPRPCVAARSRRARWPLTTVRRAPRRSPPARREPAFVPERKKNPWYSRMPRARVFSLCPAYPRRQGGPGYPCPALAVGRIHAPASALSPGPLAGRVSGRSRRAAGAGLAGSGVAGSCGVSRVAFSCGAFSCGGASGAVRGAAVAVARAGLGSGGLGGRLGSGWCRAGPGGAGWAGPAVAGAAGSGLSGRRVGRLFGAVRRHVCAPIAHRPESGATRSGGRPGVRGRSPPPCPRASRRPWLAVPGFCALFVRLPPRRALGLCALRALRLRRATRVRSLRSPLRALAPVFAAGLRALAPSALPLGGRSVGVPLVPGARSWRAFRRSLRRAGGGFLGSLAFFGGVSWLVRLWWFLVVARFSPRPGGVGWSVRPCGRARAAGACAPRRARSRARSSWSVFRALVAPLRSRRRGLAGAGSRWPSSPAPGARGGCGRFPSRWPPLVGCRSPRRRALAVAGGFVAGRVAVVAAAGPAGCAAFVPQLAALVGCWPGCRSRWLVRGARRALAVRAPSPLLAALLCRRARAFGLAPCLAGRSRRLVLLPVARSRGPGPLSLRLAGAAPLPRRRPLSLSLSLF